MRRIVVMGLALIVFPAAAAAQSDSAASQESIEVSSDSPPSVLLAFYDMGTVRIPADTAEKYESKLDRLSTTCRDSPSSLAGSVRAGAELLRNHASRTVSTYELLERLRNSVGGPLNAQPQCSDLLASIVMTLGGERLELSIAKLTSELKRAAAQGGGG